MGLSVVVVKRSKIFFGVFVFEYAYHILYTYVEISTSTLLQNTTLRLRYTISSVKRRIMKLFGTVYAHCDVPCGVYETDTMRNAAYTCKVMVQKMLDLGHTSDPEHLNSYIRMVTTKEKHAETVKHEVRILWGDYFKPEHLEQCPDLHDKVWQIMKAASKVKQGVDLADADALIARVLELEGIFKATKQ